MNLTVLLIKVGDAKLPPGVLRGAHEYQLSRIEQWDDKPQEWTVAGVFSSPEDCAKAIDALCKHYINYNITLNQVPAILDKMPP